MSVLQVPRSMRARCCAAVPRIVVVLLLLSIYTLFVVDVNTWGVSVMALKAFASWVSSILTGCLRDKL